MVLPPSVQSRNHYSVSEQQGRYIILPTPVDTQPSPYASDLPNVAMALAQSIRFLLRSLDTEDEGNSFYSSENIYDDSDAIESESFNQYEDNMFSVGDASDNFDNGTYEDIVTNSENTENSEEDNSEELYSDGDYTGYDSSEDTDSIVPAIPGR